MRLNSLSRIATTCGSSSGQSHHPLYGVDIPGNFAFYNEAMNSGQLPLPETSAPDYAEGQAGFAKAYTSAIPVEKRANRCVDCEACLSKCPQQIRIPNQMGRIVSLLRKR